MRVFSPTYGICTLALDVGFVDNATTYFSGSVAVPLAGLAFMHSAFARTKEQICKTT